MILGQRDLLGGYHRIGGPKIATDWMRNPILIRGQLSIRHNNNLF
jgi:hypothetical protein